MHFAGINFCSGKSVNDIRDGLFAIFNFYIQVLHFVQICRNIKY